MRLTRLEDIKTLKPFDCGDDDLNGFLIGFGTRLVAGIKQMLLMQQSQSACRFLTVDAYRVAVPFYVKNGFKMLVNEIAEEAYTVPMYYDLKQLKQ